MSTLFDYGTDQINAVIRNRRSIYPKDYETVKLIPDKIIWQILENANRAPNHKQTEPWRFNVFSGEGLKGRNNYRMICKYFFWRQTSSSVYLLHRNTCRIR